MTEAINAPKPSYTKFATAALGTIAILAVVGWFPTRRLAGEDSSTAMILALVVALAASGIGTLPIWAARHGKPQDSVPAQLGAMALRLVSILVLGAAVALVVRPALQPFFLWLVLAHAALLVPDTLFARRIVQASVEREQRNDRPEARSLETETR